MPRLVTIPRAQTPQGRRATPDDFGAQVPDSGFSQALQFAGKVATQIVVADREGALSSASSELAESAARIRAGMQGRVPLKDREEAFREAFKTRRQEIEEAHDLRTGGWAQRFDQRAKSLEARQALEVNLETQRFQIQQAAANLETSGSRYADLSGASPDLDERARIRTDYEGDLLSAEKVGTIAPARRAQLLAAYDSAVGDATARRLAREAPGLLRELLSEGEESAVFSDMPEKTRQAWIDRADEAIAQEARIAKARDKESRALAEKQRKQLEDETAKDGYSLVNQGRMSTEWVMQHRDSLSREAFKYFTEQAAAGGGEAGIPNPREYHRLRLLRETDPRAFERESLDPNALGGTKLLELAEEQRKIREGGERVSTGLSFQGRVNRWLEDIDTSTSEEVQLRILADQAFTDFQRTTGEKPDPTQEQSILDEILLARVRERSTFFGLGSDTQILEADEFPEIPGVPPDQIPRIVDALKRRGQRVSADSVWAVWQRVQP